MLALTARDAVADRGAGLDAGADDYLVKPSAFDELVARIRGSPAATTRDRASIFVTDTGPGIDPENHDRVIERYWTTDAGDGLGIGLAVAKQVGDAHKGLDIESPLTAAGGTRCTLRFRI